MNNVFDFVTQVGGNFGTLISFVYPPYKISFNFSGIKVRALEDFDVTQYSRTKYTIFSHKQVVLKKMC